MKSALSLICSLLMVVQSAAASWPSPGMVCRHLPPAASIVEFESQAVNVPACAYRLSAPSTSLGAIALRIFGGVAVFAAIARGQPPDLPSVSQHPDPAAAILSLWLAIPLISGLGWLLLSPEKRTGATMRAIESEAGMAAIAGAILGGVAAAFLPGLSGIGAFLVTVASVIGVTRAVNSRLVGLKISELVYPWIVFGTWLAGSLGVMASSTSAAPGFGRLLTTIAILVSGYAIRLGLVAEKRGRSESLNARTAAPLMAAVLAIFYLWNSSPAYYLVTGMLSPLLAGMILLRDTARNRDREPDSPRHRDWSLYQAVVLFGLFAFKAVPAIFEAAHPVGPFGHSFVGLPVGIMIALLLAAPLVAGLGWLILPSEERTLPPWRDIEKAMAPIAAAGMILGSLAVVFLPAYPLVGGAIFLATVVACISRAFDVRLAEVKLGKLIYGWLGAGILMAAVVAAVMVGGVSVIPRPEHLLAHGVIIAGALGSRAGLKWVMNSSPPGEEDRRHEVLGGHAETPLATAALAMLFLWNAPLPVYLVLGLLSSLVSALIVMRDAVRVGDGEFWSQRWRAWSFYQTLVVVFLFGVKLFPPILAMLRAALGAMSDIIPHFHSTNAYIPSAFVFITLVLSAFFVDGFIRYLRDDGGDVDVSTSSRSVMASGYLAFVKGVRKYAVDRFRRIREWIISSLDRDETYEDENDDEKPSLGPALFAGVMTFFIGGELTLLVAPIAGALWVGGAVYFEAASGLFRFERLMNIDLKKKDPKEKDIEERENLENLLHHWFHEYSGGADIFAARARAKLFVARAKRLIFMWFIGIFGAWIYALIQAKINPASLDKTLTGLWPYDYALFFRMAIIWAGIGVSSLLFSFLRDIYRERSRLESGGLLKRTVRKALQMFIKEWPWLLPLAASLLVYGALRVVGIPAPIYFVFGALCSLFIGLVVLLRSLDHDSSDSPEGSIHSPPAGLETSS